MTNCPNCGSTKIDFVPDKLYVCSEAGCCDSGLIGQGLIEYEAKKAKQTKVYIFRLGSSHLEVYSTEAEAQKMVDNYRAQAKNCDPKHTAPCSWKAYYVQGSELASIAGQ